MALETRVREGNSDLILFLHGIGCGKENFEALWEAPELTGPTLLAPDLPGHGASQDLPSESWSMTGMADAVAELLAPYTGRSMRLHLVVHSMGGAVGLILAQQPPVPVASFVNIEGNLIGSDCGMFSRRAAAMDLEKFRDEAFDKVKARARSSEDPIIHDWAGWLDACTAESLHACATSLVEWSDGGILLDMFLRISARKIYVYGEHAANLEVFPKLGPVPVHEIPDCGHFSIIEKPQAVADVIAKIMASSG